ncbi:FecR family protein [Pararhodonellum marinum]|uniref:FecR family protein n=1 Tax=Pararhodonellum marinum TaxID=2755358 RepID=UPI00188EF6A8|nr:FecR domain-containing protein [Pararhodonellum marinum]
MKENSEHIEDLISKFLVGEASEKESRTLREWCARSPENQKYLDDARWIFDRAQLPDQPDFDTDIAWAKVKSKIKPEKDNTRTLMPLWKVAAGLALLMGLSYLFYILLTPIQEFQFTSGNQVLTEWMPDRTEIALNQDSEIRVEYHERKNSGTIHLNGEALISIPEDKKVNWTVKAGELLIEDIGTVFHVKAIPNNPVVEVNVQEGMVRFYTLDQAGITLQAGERGTYDRDLAAFSKAALDPNVVSFKTRVFTFQEEELDQVVARLEEVYGRTIVLEGPIASCRLSVVFEDEDLSTILSILSETLNLQVLDEGQLIRLKGDGCY